MSGEAFNGIAYRTEFAELYERRLDLMELRDALVADNRAHDLVTILDQLIYQMNKIEIVFNNRYKDIYPVIKAFCWWRSGDSNEVWFTSMLEGWRNGAIY